MSLLVITRDAFGNRRTASSGSAVTLALVDTTGGDKTISSVIGMDACAAADGESACTGAGACTYTADNEGTTDVDEEACEAIMVTDTDDGQYTIVYGHNAADVYRLDVSVGSTVLPTAAFEGEDSTVTIAPGPVSLGTGDTTVEGSGLSVASAGVQASFTVTTKDAYQNTVDDSSMAIQAGLTFDETCTTCKFTGARSTSSGGVFTFTYTATALGNYNLNLKIGGADVSGSPFAVEVQHVVLD
jgi:hypothetical protein